MGFIKNSKYGIEVFLTDVGMEKLFLGEGLKNAISYFTLGTSEGDYRAYMNSNDTPLEFIVNKGDFLNGYYADPDNSNSEVTIIDNNLTRIAGKTQYGKTFDKQIFRTAETTLSELIIYYPDFDTHTTYTFDSFKNGSTGKKYFNLGLNGYPAFPLVVGGNNMYELTNTGGMKHQETKTWGYITTEEITGISNITKANNYPFPGVGVGIDTTHYKTEFQKFEIVNKSSQTIYLYNYNISEIVASKSHKISNVNLLYNNPDDPATSGSTLYIAEYIVTWTDLLNNTREDGRLRIKADKDFLLGNKETLLPFEVVEFWVQYEVSSDDDGNFDPAHHYHGQTSDNKNRKEGQISFNFIVNASKTKIEVNTTPSSDDLLTTNIGIIIQVKDDTFEITGLNPIQTTYITDESLNGGSPCSATYTNGIIYAPIGQTIAEVYANNLAGLEDSLRSGRLPSSNKAKAGYYMDINTVTAAKEYQTYYWNESTFSAIDANSSKSYFCELYNNISVYYTVLTNSPGEFIEYTQTSAKIYCADYDSMDAITDGQGVAYTNDYQKIIIPDGYYVTSLSKSGGYSVYKFVNNATTKWTKLTFSEPTAVSTYYSILTNDCCDTRTGKYNSATYYQNTSVDGSYTDTRYYSDVDNLILADSGYYALSTTKPFNGYKYLQTDFNPANIFSCIALFTLSNTYFSSDPTTGYATATAYCSKAGVTTIPLAYSNTTLLFTTDQGTTLIPSGYYITSTTATPATPYTAYQFNDGTTGTEGWVGTISVNTPITLYYYSGSDPRTDYTNYTTVTVYHTGTSSVSARDALANSALYGNYSASSNVANGYYTAIDPTQGHSFTYYQYTNGVKSGPYYKAEHIRIYNDHIGTPGYDDTNVYYAAAEGSGCFAEYQTRELYAYLETMKPVLYCLSDENDESIPNIRDYSIYGVQNGVGVPLYTDMARTQEAAAGYYAVPRNLSGPLDPDTNKMDGPYTWYYYNNLTHRITSQYYCQPKVAEFSFYNIAATQTSLTPESYYAAGTTEIQVTLETSNTNLVEGLTFVIQGCIANSNLNNTWTISRIVSDTEFVFEYPTSVNFNYASNLGYIRIEDGLYRPAYQGTQYYIDQDVIGLMNVINSGAKVYQTQFGLELYNNTYFANGLVYNFDKAWHAFRYDVESSAWDVENIEYCDHQVSSGTTTTISIATFARTVALQYEIDDNGNWVEADPQTDVTMYVDYLINDFNDLGVGNVNNAYVYGTELGYYQTEVLVDYERDPDEETIRTLLDLYLGGVPLMNHDGNVADTGVYIQNVGNEEVWFFWDATIYNNTSDASQAWAATNYVAP